MITHIAYANFTQFKFCDSEEEAQDYIELAGDGRIFVDSAEVNRLRRALEAINSLRGLCLDPFDRSARDASAAAFAEAADLARCALDDPRSFMEK